MKRWLLSLTCLGLASVALTQQAPPAPNPVREACQADIQKLCNGVQPGGGRIRECILQHRDELSPACRDALANARAHRRATKGAAPQTPSSAPPPEARTTG